MSDQEWTEMIGLRNATLSLLWRTLVAGLLWCVLLWGFDALITAVGDIRIPALIVYGFTALSGTIAGITLSRGLDETAGFVSPVLTIIAGIFTAIAIIGGEALIAPHLSGALGNHSRFLLVGITMVVALVWVTKNTLIDT